MRSAAVFAIDGYRRFVSPHKGFRCAHHHAYGEGSCSAFGRTVFAEHRFLAALSLLRGRLAGCRTAMLVLQSASVDKWRDVRGTSSAASGIGSADDDAPTTDGDGTPE